MLDPALLRDRLDEIRKKLGRRGVSLSDELAALERLDAERRQILPVLEKMRQSRKEVGTQIARAKREGHSADDLLKAGQDFGVQIKDQEARLEQVENERQSLLLALPNVPHDSVPVGTGADDLSLIHI